MSTRFLPYDWFKLIVLILLIALLILFPRCVPEGGVPSTESEVQPVESAMPATQADTATQAPTTTTEAASQESPSAIVECDGALPVRLSGVGVRAVVVNALIPLRASPEVSSNNILRGLPIGSVVEITSLPVCTPYLTGANNWWGVRTEDGSEGYTAEGSAINPVYYLQELP